MKHIENFYTPPENIVANTVEINGNELTHLARVKRKKARDIVNVVDGEGNLYTVLLTEMKKNVARGEIQKKTRFAGESNFELILAQAVPKGSRFDWVIEKGTELGVASFVPLKCENSLVDSSPSRMNRWKKIAIAAMKQSGRSVLPKIGEVQSVKQIVENTNLQRQGFIAHPAGKTKRLTVIADEFSLKAAPVKSAVILIGPEGGFSDEEVNFALENGFQPFTLGPRRLRSETAGIVSAALFMELIGSLR